MVDGPAATEFTPIPPAGAAAAARGPLPAIADDVYCQRCGYNNRGLTSTRCPECGEPLDGLRSPVSAIPWMQRRGIGRARAYWRTVYFAIFRQRQLAAEMSRPVPFADAQAFRWATVTLAFVPLAIGAIGYIFYFRPDPFDTEALNGLAQQVWPVGVAITGLWLCLAAATGIPSYFFHPPEEPVHMQNRAVALSYYACAPLAGTFLPVTLVGAAVPAYVSERPVLAFGCLLAAGALALLVLGVWWSDTVRLLCRVMPPHGRRALVMAIVLPLAWTGTAMLAIGAPVFIAFFVSLVWASYR